MREVLRGAAALLVLAALVGAGWAAMRLRPQHLDPTIASGAPIVTLENGRIGLRVPAAALAAEVGTYSDELLAYLNSQYLWSRVTAEKNGTEVILSQSAGGGAPTYHIFLVPRNDLLTAIPFLSTLEAEGYISHYRLHYWNDDELEYRQGASQVLEASYNLPAPVSFEAMDTGEMIGPLTRFILFKSRTDRRVRERIAPVPRLLSEAEARREAMDIVDVARFYHLPLDQFAGIAAQENNYLDADGDLTHAIWKRRAEPGDVVLKRRRGRVLVSDYSMGVWQITRESLRFAHMLYERDDRDYALLPARLRPSEDFRLDAKRPAVLTTYAGLLFRHLIDHFQGDVTLALGAYNGGCGNPQAGYSASVALAAASARRTVEQSMALDGWQVIPVRIVPYSLPQQTEVRPTFTDEIRGDANQWFGRIIDRVQQFRNRWKTREVAESENDDASAHEAAESAAGPGEMRADAAERPGIYTAASPEEAGNSR